MIYMFTRIFEFLIAITGVGEITALIALAMGSTDSQLLLKIQVLLAMPGYYLVSNH